MTVRLAVSIALALSLPGCSSSPQSATYRPTPSQAVKTSEESVDTPAWLRQADYRHGGPVPPMEEKRKINEQPCTAGVQLDAGNLRCK